MPKLPNQPLSAEHITPASSNGMGVTESDNRTDDTKPTAAASVLDKNGPAETRQGMVAAEVSGLLPSRQDSVSSGGVPSEILPEQEVPYFRLYWTPHFAVTALAAILMIWSFAWLYLGAFWNPIARLSNLHVAVLDCDTVPQPGSLNASFAQLLPILSPSPLATSLLSASVWNTSSPLGSGKSLTWYNVSCGNNTQGRGCGADEAACVASVSDEVLQGGRPWVLLYFPANFTSSYLSWYPTSGVMPQDQRPMGAYISARGRDFSTYTYVGSIVLQTVAPALSRSLTLGLSGSAQLLPLLNPKFLATGFGLRELDLAPVRNFGQHFATYIFCVLLWLGSSFVVATSYQFKLPAEIEVLDPHTTPKDRSVRLGKLAWGLWVKGSIAAVFMFIEMVLLCVVLWAMGDGNEQWHRNAGEAIAFGWYMSWSFISVNAVLLHAMGIERFSSASAFLLILQLTSASAILSSDLSNRFFYIGKGMPFFYGVRGFRSIFFGALTDRMWENWLVLTAYNVVLAPLSLWLIARRVWSLAGASGAGTARGRPGGAAALGNVVLPSVVGLV